MKNLRPRSKKTFGRTSILLALLLLLAACGGGEADEAVEEVGDSATSDVDDTTESEAIEDGNIGATGSEDDSGELPPTPQPGSKVDAPRVTPDPTLADLATTDSTTPINRSDAEETAVSATLDLVLLIDVTGSMADELTQLQAGLPDLADKLATLSQSTNVRLGLVAYRDRAKSDSVQVLPFTEDVALFADQIAGLTAVGGGDYPEALNEGFYQAVTNLAWRSEATKLLLILGDAPPEANNTNTPSYEETSRIAAEQNITIFTFGSDGLNTEGASIFEQIALSGNGRFYFITDNPENSHGGATAVYVTNQLPALLLEVVQEMLNEQVP